MPLDDDLQTTAPVLPPVRSIFRALVSTIVPEASSLSDEGWNDLERCVEAALNDRPAGLKRQLRLSLRAIQWLPALKHGKPFTALNAAQRKRFLSYLESHRFELVRVGFWGLRTLALLGYYARPEAARGIGYAPDPRGWEARG